MRRFLSLAKRKPKAVPVKQASVDIVHADANQKSASRSSSGSAAKDAGANQKKASRSSSGSAAKDAGANQKKAPPSNKGRNRLVDKKNIVLQLHPDEFESIVEKILVDAMVDGPQNSNYLKHFIEKLVTKREELIKTKKQTEAKEPIGLLSQPRVQEAKPDLYSPSYFTGKDFSDIQRVINAAEKKAKAINALANEKKKKKNNAIHKNTKKRNNHKPRVSDRWSDAAYSTARQARIERNQKILGVPGGATHRQTDKKSKLNNNGNKPLTVGSQVWYKGNPEGNEIAKIVAVHRNDPNNTYYTISVKGHERQTVRGKLEPMESKPTDWTFWKGKRQTYFGTENPWRHTFRTFTNDGRNFKITDPMESEAKAKAETRPKSRGSSAGVENKNVTLNFKESLQTRKKALTPAPKTVPSAPKGSEIGDILRSAVEKHRLTMRTNGSGSNGSGSSN